MAAARAIAAACDPVLARRRRPFAADAARLDRARGVVEGHCPMRTRIYVTLKPGVLDPQGKAIHHALAGLGFAGVAEVRQGKLIELDHADDVDDATLDAMCRKLLANTVIENYRIERG